MTANESVWDRYQSLAEALTEEGVVCRFQSHHQMTIASHAGSPWPDRGNTFWVTCATGKWHLFTWVPVAYAVPNEVDIVELCRCCMKHGTHAMYVVPEEIVRQFRLTQLGDSELDAIYDAMDVES